MTGGPDRDSDRVMMRVERFLSALRRSGRLAILIVDTDCGDGSLLIEAALCARELGFVDVDARGFDRSPRALAAAAKAARANADGHLRFSFAPFDGRGPFLLADEEVADLMLADVRRPASALLGAIDRDGILIHHR